MNCFRCGAPLIDRVGLAAQAAALLANLRLAYGLAAAATDHEEEQRAAVREPLEQAGRVARDLAKATSCAAGQCRAAPVAARQPDDPGPYETLVRACLTDGPAPTCDVAEVLGRSVEFTDGLLRGLERRQVVLQRLAGEPPVLTWHLVTPPAGEAPPRQEAAAR